MILKFKIISGHDNQTIASENSTIVASDLAFIFKNNEYYLLPNLTVESVNYNPSTEYTLIKLAHGDFILKDNIQLMVQFDNLQKIEKLENNEYSKNNRPIENVSFSTTSELYKGDIDLFHDTLMDVDIMNAVPNKEDNILLTLGIMQETRMDDVLDILNDKI